MICGHCHCSRGRNDIDGYVYNKDGESKILMTGNWSKSMSYQPCDFEGEPIDGTELKEVRSLFSSLQTLMEMIIVIVV